MKFLRDDVLGELSYEYGWTREYNYPLWGRAVTVKLIVPCDEDAEIEDAQRDAFARFDESKGEMVALAERAVFDYYQSICNEYRERLGVKLADAHAPRIQKIDQLEALIIPTEVVIQQSFKSGERIVGLLFRCSWEPELGLAVKFVDAEVEEVGTQDIVL